MALEQQLEIPLELPEIPLQPVNLTVVNQNPQTLGVHAGLNREDNQIIIEVTIYDRTKVNRDELVYPIGPNSQLVINECD